MSVGRTAAEAEAEPRYGWVVVWAVFTALAVIFGVSYSFAAFFESFTAEFQASRAEVSLVFGLSGLVYFVLGAFGGMLSDRFGPRRVTSAGMVCIAAALLAGRLRVPLVWLATFGWDAIHAPMGKCMVKYADVNVVADLLRLFEV